MWGKDFTVSSVAAETWRDNGMCAPLEKPHTCTVSAPLKQSPLAACFHARQNVAAKLFPAQHDDFVHDVAYDYYGKRIATCSSDEKIKVRWCVCVMCVFVRACVCVCWCSVAQRCTDTNATQHNTLQVWEQDTSGGWVCKAEWKVHLQSQRITKHFTHTCSMQHHPHQPRRCAGTCWASMEARLVPP